MKTAMLFLALMSAHADGRVEISGKVTKVGSVNYSQHVFWDAPDGAGYVRLDDAVCVFSGGAPIALSEGTACVIEGVKGRTLASGCVVYTDCKLVKP